MANVLTTNPISIDTFNADVTVAAARIKVRKITLVSAAAGDDLVFIDTLNVPVVHMAQNVAGGMVSLDFGKEGHNFNNGFIYDTSASTGLGSGDAVLIYVV